MHATHFPVYYPFLVSVFAGYVPTLKNIFRQTGGFVVQLHGTRHEMSLWYKPRKAIVYYTDSNRTLMRGAWIYVYTTPTLENTYGNFSNLVECTSIFLEWYIVHRSLESFVGSMGGALHCPLFSTVTAPKATFFEFYYSSLPRSLGHSGNCIPILWCI